MSILSKRFPTLIGIAILIAGLTGSLVLVRKQQTIAPRASSTTTPINPQITNIFDHSFTVIWTTAAPAVGYIQFGQSPQNISEKVIGSESTTHSVTVPNLSPSTTYYFQIGSGITVYDRQGTPYSVATAPNLTNSPSPDTAQGLIKTSAGSPAVNVIIYTQLPGGQLISTTTTSSGNWLIPLSTTRLADLNSFLEYDRSSIVYTLQIDAGPQGRAAAIVTTALDRPVPPITLGNTYDFRQSRNPITSTSIKPTDISPAAGQSGIGSSIFSFDSLESPSSPNSSVTLENPAQEGQIIKTQKPEFFGRGPQGQELEITVESELVLGNTLIDQSGRWSFAIPSDLDPGTHTITLKWTDEYGVIQTLIRTFQVYAADGSPAYTSTPSATPASSFLPLPTGVSSPTPTFKIIPTAPPRTSVPSTQSGVPQSGETLPTLILFIIGLILIIFGTIITNQEKLYGR